MVKKSATTVTAEQIVVALAQLIEMVADYSPGAGPVAPAPSAPVVDEAEEAEAESLDRDEVEAMGIKELRLLAVENGITAKKKSEILAAMDEANLFADEDDEEEEEEEEEEEDEEEDDDEEEEEEGYDRDELAEKSLKELRTIAKAEGHSAAEYRGMDQDALVDLIMGEDEEEEAEAGDDDEVEEIDEDSLNEMGLPELKSLAGDLGLKLKKGAKKPDIIQQILDSAE